MRKQSKFLFLFYVVSLLFILLPIMSFFKKDYFFVLNQNDFNFVVSAFKVSAICSFEAMLIVVVLGVPAAYFMAHAKFRGKEYIDLLFHIPMVLPPAVTGLILLMTFGNKGIIGKYISAVGFNITFSKTAVVLALIFVALPVFISGTAEGFSKVDPELETAAMLLGDSPIKVFKRITFPLAKSSILTSLIMSWARALAEFGATMMFAGNVMGITQTVPLAIYTSMESNVNLSMFLSFIMILFSLAILIMVHFISKRSYGHD